MAGRWTKEQLDAINENGCDLLVAAAAGAGKTAVLVERIIRKITHDVNPVDIDRLLIVTFTNAAATEMRERIGDAIVKALETNPGSKVLQRQLTLLHRASITTIHSFCLDVIRNNSHLTDIDPDFRIADATESVLMKGEVLEELFEEKYQEDSNREFLNLVECYGGSRDDRRLQELVLDLYEFVQSHPWPEKWLKKSTEAFNLPEGMDFSETEWGKTVLKNVKLELEGLLSILKSAADAAHSTRGLEPYVTCIDDDTERVSQLLAAVTGKWDGICAAFSSLEFGRLPRCGKDADEGVGQYVKAARDDVKKRLGKHKSDTFTADSCQIAGDLQSVYPLMACLSRLVLEFGEKYAARKHEKSLLDFNDLEHLCLEILTATDENGNTAPSGVAYEYRERFEEILVDEYQDSNLVQEVLLGTISRRGSDRPNMFMVGDVKQSIYRFRQARPELFLEKYNRYADTSGGPDRRILLYKNFRSRKEVINGVNFIFRQIMSEAVGELDYGDSEALNYGSDYDDEERKIELHILDAADDEALDVSEAGTAAEGSGEDSNELEETEDKPDLIQCEARLAARRIKELMGASGAENSLRVYDKKLGSYRNAEYRDIVVLMRTTRNWADIFLEELGIQGIPAYADTSGGYFQTVEVQTMMSLLQVIDNPFQDIPLLSVLRSPVAAFTPDELVDIRMADKESAFYQALKKAAEGDSGVAEKTRTFLSRLDKWRKKSLYMSIDELIWYLYSDTGYYSYAGAMPGGVRRQANLRMLFERARQYEKTSYKGLFNFINFIDRLKSSGGDMGSARVLGENDNVVRIMSIHKSKGLEFPIVIVAGCGKRFNLQDMNRSILFHHDLGFGPDLVDPEKRISYPTAPKEALRQKIKLETLSEEMRILYVAFTRAREKLIITGTARDFSSASARWADCPDMDSPKLPQYKTMKAMNYLDWIGPAVMGDRNPGWKVVVWEKKKFHSAESQESADSDLLDWIGAHDGNQSAGEHYEEVDRRLGWVYPYSASVKLPTKVSVTELKKRFNAEFSGELGVQESGKAPLVRNPQFLEGVKEPGPAEKGTVLHFVMQHLDLRHTSGVDDISCQVRNMVDNELISEYQSAMVDLRKILEFLKSPLGMRVLKAERVFREVSFNIELESVEDDFILLQGVIDCYFEEGDGIVLIDYKTDYVPKGGVHLIKERYAMQIEYYTRALEKLTGKRVKEKYIYLFWNGEVIRY